MIGIAHKAGAANVVNWSICEPSSKTRLYVPVRTAQRCPTPGFAHVQAGSEWGFFCMNPATRVFAPIPTLYQGVQFRSRTEARWAAFFDAINLPWQYEPEGYSDGETRYLPDFWLPKIFNRGKDLGGCFFEVKAAKPTPADRRKCEMLARGSEKVVILAENGPTHSHHEWLHEFVVSNGNDWSDEGLQFAMCDLCGNIDIGFYASDEPNCSCDLGTFSPEVDALKVALRGFSNYARWGG